MIRRPLAAGLFYPAEAAELAALVDRLLGTPEAGDPPAAVVAPHAGYDYSGLVAAAALRLVPAGARVALLGPSHFVPLRGLAVSTADAWETAFGRVPVALDLRDAALAAGAVADDRPHARDHALEVQLPFLQQICGDTLEIVPIAVGASTPAAVAEAIARLSDVGALVIVSTDLSHYEDEATARQRDRRTADAVLAREPGLVGETDACGVFALRGLVEHARRAQLEAELLALRTSADAGGGNSSVVGYAAFAFRRQAGVA